MAYQIELEDRGQDLIRLTVNFETGVIEDAGLCSWLYANGEHVVDVERLHEDRIVHFRKNGGPDQWFKYPMIRLSLDGELLAAA
ncbi:hypothetical protein [Oceanicola sp. S124]|uniref:hypothetical protein n=1 Tax=Oceanicola sp. S124 TaxID=1042378 RepID=UPI0002559EF7|nr:hypothetical protein [Oceanicola sp. S124]